MARLGKKLFARIPELIANPRRAMALLSRVFPLRAMERDSDLYHAISAWSFGRLERVPIGLLFPGIAGGEVTIIRGLDRLDEVGVTLRELVTLAALVAHIRARKVLEIGTSNGNTTVNIASNLPPEGEVVTVDLPVEWDGNFGLSVPTALQNVTDRRIVGAHYRESRVASRVRQVFGDSAKLDWSTLGGPFDMVFIDGNHSYDYVRLDTANARRHVRPNGLILWHDYGTIEDVSRAVDEAGADLNASVVLGTSLAVATMPSGPHHRKGS